MIYPNIYFNKIFITLNLIFILIHKNFDEKIPQHGDYDDIDLELISKVKQIPNQVINKYNEFKIHEALDLTMNLFRLTNKYLEVKAPWKSIKEDKSQGSQTATTLYVAAEILRIGAILITPIIPNKSKKVLHYLGTQALNETSFGELEIGANTHTPENLFPRIDPL